MDPPPTIDAAGRRCRPRPQVRAEGELRPTDIVKEVGDKRFVLMAGKFVNIEDLNIDLIDTVNPFQKAFEVLSKSVTKQVLRLIQDAIDATRLEMSEEEALLLWPKINDFARRAGKPPDRHSSDPQEQRMAEALLLLQ